MEGIERNGREYKTILNYPKPILHILERTYMQMYVLFKFLGKDVRNWKGDENTD